jgi:hypothetical protein
MVRPSYGRWADETNTPTEILASNEGWEKVGCLIDNSDAAIAASYTTTGGNANSHVKFTAKQAGVAGNQLAVVLDGTGGVSHALELTSVQDGIVTITLATSAGSAITTTANELVAFLAGQATFQALMSCAIAGTETGVGIMAALANTHLASGADLAGAATLVKGTILGMVTATGLYKAYNNSLSDGTEVAVGILGDTVDADLTDQNDLRLAASMYVRGTFYEAALTGLDSAAKTDLKSRTVGSGATALLVI